MRLLKRDPVARVDYVREVIPVRDRRKSCGWCGAQRAKYRYGISRDDGRLLTDARAFCGYECRDAFNA